jgi:hypothetical protein
MFKAELKDYAKDYAKDSACFRFLNSQPETLATVCKRCFQRSKPD